MAEALDRIVSNREQAREEWRPVAGYEGMYSVSDAGRVRSEPRTVERRGAHAQRLSGRVLAQGAHPGGYRIVTFSVGGKLRTVLVHKLVLEAFKGPRPVGLEARHLNGCADDNRAINLEWGTPLDNADDRQQHGTQVRGRLVGNSKLIESQVRAIRADQRSQSAVAVEYGISQTMVSRIKLGKVWGWLA